jgi:non-ribosomal peptide synthetase component E (peptide arylation enzyme)
LPLRWQVVKIAVLLGALPFQATPMETPLTPLEFARRARKLYPDRVAVIDGGSRWTYAQFFERCDRWSAVL